MVVVPQGPGFQAGQIAAPRNIAAQQQAQAGQAVFALGVEALRAKTEEEQRIDIAYARTADSEAEFGDLDAWDKLRALQGPQAIAAADAAASDYDERTQRGAESLPNDRSRNAFLASRAQGRLPYLRRVSTFKAGVVRDLDRAAAFGQMDSAKRGMGSLTDVAEYLQGASEQDPEKREQKQQSYHDRRAKVVLTATRYAQREGLDAKAYVIDQLTAVHSDIINQLIADGELEKASAFLAATREDNIRNKEAIELQKSIAAAVARRNKVDNSDELNRQARKFITEKYKAGWDEARVRVELVTNPETYGFAKTAEPIVGPLFEVLGQARKREADDEMEKVREYFADNPRGKVADLEAEDQEKLRELNVYDDAVDEQHRANAADLYRRRQLTDEEFNLEKELQSMRGFVAYRMELYNQQFALGIEPKNPSDEDPKIRRQRDNIKQYIREADAMMAGAVLRIAQSNLSLMKRLGLSHPDLQESPVTTAAPQKNEFERIEQTPEQREREEAKERERVQAEQQKVLEQMLPALQEAIKKAFKK